MKQYLIPILATALLLASGLLTGCSHDKPSLTEKQVIEMTYEYLITKAKQLQGLDAVLKKAVIDERFVAAELNASRETEWDSLGELVEVEFLSQSTWTNVLKKLADYEGDGLWSVSIDEWEWQLNEETGEVTAENDEAAKLLEETTLKTYHNSSYSYSVDYRPDWEVYDHSKDSVIISGGIFKGYVGVWVYEKSSRDLGDLEGQALLDRYALAARVALEGNLQEFELVDSDRGYPVFRIHYTYLDGENWERQHYFIVHEDMFYEVISGATLFDPPLLGSYSHLSSDLYDGYKTFRFEP